MVVVLSASGKTRTVMAEAELAFLFVFASVAL